MSATAAAFPRPVLRARLTRRLAEGPVGVIEAGAGYGKSVLASQYRQTLGIASAYVPLGAADGDSAVLAGSLHRALLHARLSDLAAATDAADPEQWIDQLLDALTPREGILLVLDDAHHLRTAQAATLVMRLARGLPSQHRLLIAARGLARSLEPLWALPEAIRLDTQELAFTVDEARDLLAARAGRWVGEHDVRVAVESTHGWATALVLAAAARSLDGHALPPRGELPRDPVATPLHGILGAIAPDVRATVLQLGHLPLISPELCDTIAGQPGAFESIIAGGVPVARTDSGWWELPSPVAAYLVEQAPVMESTVRAAAESYLRGGAPVAALRVLTEAGMVHEAAWRLASMAPDRVEDLGLGVVRELVESLPAAVLAAYPGALLHLARLAETAHQPELRASTLQRAETLIAAESAPELGRELEAELARDLMWDERTRGQARTRAEAVVRDAAPAEMIARARALDVLGRLGAWFSAVGPVPEAEGLLLQSARLARRIGQPTWTAQALVALGAGFYFALCRFDRALDVLDEAMAELPARNRYRAMVESFRGDTLCQLGRWEEAEAALAYMREIGHAVGEQWILAFAAWSEAQLAAAQGDAARTVRAYRTVDAHRDSWFDEPAGGECLVQVADALSLAGEHELALECLARAEEKMEGNERIVRVHGAAVLSRSGDLRAAQEAIELALGGPAAEPQQLWPLYLQRAYVALRGDDPSAGELAAQAFEYCATLGQPELPLVRERALTSALLPLAMAAGSPAAAALSTLQAHDSWSIRLLGGFEVRRGGAPLSLPGGFPSKVVRVVAVAGGRMHTEELIELMWPGAAPALGRNRLRNLLSRVRVSAGELLRREGDAVVLASECELDTARFEAGAAAALTARAPDDRRRAVILARAALERYRGELLPDDRYEPWTEVARERLRLRQLELIDLLTAAAEDDDEYDEAIRLLGRAIDVEPCDEPRYVQLARLLELQGRTGSALSVLRQARGALRNAGLIATGELDRAEADLRV